MTQDKPIRCNWRRLGSVGSHAGWGTSLSFPARLRQDSMREETCSGRGKCLCDSRRPAQDTWVGPAGSSCPALVPFFVPILEMLIVLVEAVQSWVSCEVEQLVRGGSGHIVTTDVFLLGRFRVTLCPHQRNTTTSGPVTRMFRGPGRPWEWEREPGASLTWGCVLGLAQTVCVSTSPSVQQG